MGRVVRRDDESADMRATLAAEERTIRDIMSETAKLRTHTPRPIDLGAKARYHGMLSRDLSVSPGRIPPSISPEGSTRSPPTAT
jgi:hypothetical protein